MWIVRNLGLVGLYKGASACLLRDGTCCLLLHLDVADPSISSLLRHLLPYLQPSEERFLRRESTKVTRRTTNAERWCHRWYACSVLDHTVRRYQDQVTGRGTKGRSGIHWSSSCGDNHLQGRRFQGVLQGRACPYHAIVSTIRFHAGWL